MDRIIRGVKEVRKEFFFNLLFTILINIARFIENKYFIQCMGIETLGMMKLFSQLLAYLNIVEMGIGSASTFALYKPLAEKDYKKVSIILSTIEGIYNKIGILLFVLGLFCIPFISFFIDVPNFSKKVYLYWILYVANTVSTYLFVKYIILFTANQEYLYIRKNQTIITIFFKISQIIFIILYHSFFIYIILLILDSLVQWRIFKRHYKKNYPYISKTKEKFEGIKNDIKNLFWHKIGGLVVFNTDLLLISKFSSLEVVGIYASYQMILQVLNTLTSVLRGVLTPKIGKYIAIHTKEEIYVYFKKINILYCFMAIFFTYCTLNLIDNFISLWIGKDFLLNKLTLNLIAFNLWVNLFRWNLEMFKMGAGFFDDIISPISESIINLVISIILGINLGLNGVIIGTITSNIIIILIYVPIITFKRCFNKGLNEYIKTYGQYFILSLISMLVLNNTVRNFINTEIVNWSMWILEAIKISSLSLIILTIIFLFNKEFREIIINIKKYLK